MTGSRWHAREAGDEWEVRAIGKPTPHNRIIASGCTEEDARLIASAPDLLAENKRLVMVIESAMAGMIDAGHVEPARVLLEHLADALELGGPS